MIFIAGGVSCERRYSSVEFVNSSRAERRRRPVIAMPEPIRLVARMAALDALKDADPVGFGVDDSIACAN